MKGVNLDLVNSSSVSRLTKLDEELDANDPGATEYNSPYYHLNGYKYIVTNFSDYNVSKF